MQAALLAEPAPIVIQLQSDQKVTLTLSWEAAQAVMPGAAAEALRRRRDRHPAALPAGDVPLARWWNLPGVTVPQMWASLLLAEQRDHATGVAAVAARRVIQRARRQRVDLEARLATGDLVGFSALAASICWQIEWERDQFTRTLAADRASSAERARQLRDLFELVDV